MDKVQRWRAALTEVANLSGWDLRNIADGHEAKFIQKITQDISSELNRNHEFLYVTKHPVGLDSRVKKINSLLDLGSSDDVRIIGIYGIGGIGKTTIAKAVYNQIVGQFEGSSFLANVREVSTRHGLFHLQRELLSEILMEKNLNISNDDRGVSVIQERLRYKRVLIILDDVDHPKQIEKLAGKPDWFGLGSRIIITTRDQQLLDTYEVNGAYNVEKLNNVEALKLFSVNAFKDDHPTREFLELSKCVVNYAKGLPLALNVLGSFLCKRTIDEWKSELDKLQSSPNKEIYDTLKVSFDGLDDTEKDIFLDVACFFNGENKDYVTEVLESCGFYPDVGLGVLTERSLISILNNRLWMHDLLQQMGREIVYRESPKEPGKRSRLWLQEDIYHVLTENTGTEAVEGIILNLPTSEAVHFSYKAFARMNKLRLLKVCAVHFSGGFQYFFGNVLHIGPQDFASINKVQVLKDNYIHPYEDFNLSNELRCLIWHGCPSKSMPSSFHPKNLVELDLRDSCIERLWQSKILGKLEFLNLSHSQYLIETPDFSGMPSLKILILEGCTRLVEVHPSNLVLDRLVYLNLKDCKSLRSLWKSIKLESLEILILSGCSKLGKFPEVLGTMEHLSQVYLNGTGIKELPSAIEHLTGLILLDLENCKNLVSLPSSICELKSLETLILSGCSKLEKFPEVQGTMENLFNVYLGGTGIKELPSFFEHLSGLVLLDLENCKNLVSLPNSICELKSLETLILSGCSKLEKLPENLGNMQNLMDLDLGGISIREASSSIADLKNLQTLSLRGCGGSMSNSWKSILRLSWLLPRKIPYSIGLLLPSLSSLCSLTELDLSDCNLSEGAISDNIVSLSSLKHLNLSKNNFVSLPAILSQFTRLFSLELEHCTRLESLPPLPSGLVRINAHGCRSLEKLPPCIDNVVHNLRFSNCKKLAGRHIPENFRRSSQAISGEDGVQILIPGSEIPQWFEHQSTGSSIYFKMSPLDYKKCKAVALCCVLTINRVVDWEVQVSCQFRDVNSSTDYSLDPAACIEFPGKTISDHVWMICVPRYFFEGKKSSDGWRHFEASYEIKCVVPDDQGTVFGIIGQSYHMGTFRIIDAPYHQVKRCGFHIFYKEDEPATMQFTSPLFACYSDEDEDDQLEHYSDELDEDDQLEHYSDEDEDEISYYSDTQINYYSTLVEEEDVKLKRSLDKSYSDGDEPSPKRLRGWANTIARHEAK